MRSDVAIDVYAHTNPAFWSVALSNFVAGYAETDSSPLCPYPLLFLPMPLSFTSEARRRFVGTNRKTGLLSWLERNPSVRATVAREMVAAKFYSRRALAFGLTHKLITSSDGWEYSLGSGENWTKPRWSAKTDQRGEVLRACKRLGQWCAPVDIPTIFIALGVRP